MYVGDRDPKATAAMILGILALLFSWIPVLGLVSWPLGVLGLILGLTSQRQLQARYRVAGIVTSSLALVVCAIWALWSVTILTQYQ